MTHLTLSDEAREFVDFLHRGGVKSYWWAEKNDYGQTIWFDSGNPAPLLNSQHNMFFGVHPCAAIPPTNSKGKEAKPKHVRSQIAYIAAINCLFGEFDGKAFVPVTDDEAEQERQEQLAEGKQITLADARNRVQKRIFVTAPDVYKALALAHIEALDPCPSAVIDSGGGYHVYWLLVEPFMLDDDTKRMRAKRVQYAWVDRIGSDDDAKDLTRILRPPGTRNFKPAYAPNYPTVQFVWCDYGLLYTFDKLAALVSPETPPKVNVPRPAVEPSGDERLATSGGRFDADFETIATAVRNVGRLKDSRRDSYHEWIGVGMALYWLGRIGYEVWDKWSKPSTKYQFGECAAKWETFNPDTVPTPITLDTLARWADEDDPDGAEAVPEQVQQKLIEYKREEKQRLQILTNPVLEDREKVAWLAIRNTLDVRQALRPDGSVRLSGEDVGRLMGRSESTGNRAIRMLEQHGVLVCDPIPLPLSSGKEVPQMHVQSGPAYDNPKLVMPATTKKKRGGARPGAGRRPRCKTCPPNTPIVEKTIKQLVCTGCGDVLDELLVNRRELEPEINIDCTESAQADQSALPDEVPMEAEGAFSFDCREEAQGEPVALSDEAPPDDATEIKVECTHTIGNYRRNSAFVPLVIDDPSELPGVKAGSFSPNDPWLALQAELKRQAGQGAPPC